MRNTKQSNPFISRLSQSLKRLFTSQKSTESTQTSPLRLRVQSQDTTHKLKINTQPREASINGLQAHSDIMRQLISAKSQISMMRHQILSWQSLCFEIMARQTGSPQNQFGPKGTTVINIMPMEKFYPTLNQPKEKFEITGFSINGKKFEGLIECEK